MKIEKGSWRARWAAVGAAVAVAVGAGGGIAITNAAISTGVRAVFVPIVPCRVLDTRPATQVGPRSTPLAQGETYTQVIWGLNGNCTIPTDATAVAMNVTVTDGTLGSFLTVWPSDAASRPNASSLNWQPGQAATPNKVDVKLSADGKVNFFNAAGTVNVLADIVGYYADHNFDDRYLSKTGSVMIAHPAFDADSSGGTAFANGCIRSTGSGVLEASVPLPLGVTVTGFKAFVIDSAATDVTVTLFRVDGFTNNVAQASTSGTPGLTTITATAATPDTVQAGEYFFLRFNPTANFNSTDICGAEVMYAG